MSTRGYRRCEMPGECHRLGPWSDRFQAHLCRSCARLALRFVHPTWLRAHPFDGPAHPHMIVWLHYRPEIHRQLFEPCALWARLNGKPALNRRGLPYIRRKGRRALPASASGGRSIVQPLTYSKQAARR